MRGAPRPVSYTHTDEHTPHTLLICRRSQHILLPALSIRVSTTYQLAGASAQGSRKGEIHATSRITRLSCQSDAKFETRSCMEFPCQPKLIKTHVPSVVLSQRRCHATARFKMRWNQTKGPSSQPSLVIKLIPLVKQGLSNHVPQTGTDKQSPEEDQRTEGASQLGSG